MLKRKISFYFLIVLLVISSCGKLEQIEMGQPQDIRVKSMSLNAVNVIVDLPISNPSRLKVKVVDINLKVWIDGKYQGKLIGTEPIVITSREEMMYAVPMKIIVSNVFGAASLFKKYNSGKRLNLRFEGEIKGKVLGLPKKIIIEEEHLLN